MAGGFPTPAVNWYMLAMSAANDGSGEEKDVQQDTTILGLLCLAFDLFLPSNEVAVFEETSR